MKQMGKKRQVIGQSLTYNIYNKIFIQIITNGKYSDKCTYKILMSRSEKDTGYLSKKT